MKPIFTFLLLTVSSLSLQAQILNGSFEEWDAIENYETPRHWTTNQDTSYSRVVKDTMAADGLYSMRLESTAGSAWVNCHSVATFSTSLDQELNGTRNLRFNIKCIPDIDTIAPFCQIYINTFNNGEPTTPISWSVDNSILEFTEIEIPVSFTDVDSLSISIFSGAINGADDGCGAYTTTWIDGLEFARTTSVNLLEQSTLKIFPNPSSGDFEVKSDDADYDHFYIYDILGREIQRGMLNNNSFHIEKNGIYILQLLSSKNANKKIARKIIVQD